MPNTLEYLTDDGPKPLDGGADAHVLVVRRGGNGDFYIGTRAVNERLARTVRFRMENGGASDHPRLKAAVIELAAALGELPPLDLAALIAGSPR